MSRRQFLEALGHVLDRTSRFLEGPIVLIKLRRYTEGTSTDEKYRPMYRIFEAYFGSWSSTDNSLIDECCDELVDQYKQALKKGKDQFEGADQKKLTGSESVITGTIAPASGWATPDAGKTKKVSDFMIEK